MDMTRLYPHENKPNNTVPSKETRFVESEAGFMGQSKGAKFSGLVWNSRHILKK
jgi:hypothetical protein